MRILVGGSHGLVGTALVPRLTALGHEVTPLVRSSPSDGELGWKGVLGDNDEIEGFDAIINLAGVGIGQKRWSVPEKRRLWDSRVGLTEGLSKRLESVVNRPRVFISASAVGYYGDRGDEELIEHSSKGTGFLAELADNWEDATKHARNVGVRVVNLRSGIILSPKGGALGKQLPLFRLGMGGRLGPGTQFMSWITLHDEVEAIVHALNNKRISGPVNLTAPNPVRNVDFTSALGQALNRPTFVPAWTWMLRAGFGSQLTEEMLLASQRAIPAQLMSAGFHFRDNTIEEAFEAILQAETSDSSSETEIASDAGDVIDLDLGTSTRKRSPKPKKD